MNKFSKVVSEAREFVDNYKVSCVVYECLAGGYSLKKGFGYCTATEFTRRISEGWPLVRIFLISGSGKIVQ